MGNKYPKIVTNKFQKRKDITPSRMSLVMPRCKKRWQDLKNKGIDLTELYYTLFDEDLTIREKKEYVYRSQNMKDLAVDVQDRIWNDYIDCHYYRLSDEERELTDVEIDEEFYRGYLERKKELFANTEEENYERYE